MEPDDPEVLAVARDLGGERRVAGPARLRGSTGGEEAPEEHDPAEEEEPVRHGVQAREGHVGGADHERHEEVREPCEDRNDDEEDHRRAVHREQLVVGIAGDEVHVRLGELGPDQQRHEPAREEEHEARDDVEDPDPLVVDGRDPARDLPLCPRDRIERCLGAGRH